MSWPHNGEADPSTIIDCLFMSSLFSGRCRSPPLLFHNLLPSLYSLILCCSTSPRNRGGQPEVQVFLYIDLSIFNGLVLPRAGAILFRFRWASDAVSACCHSVQLKSESVRPWKCISGHPRGKSHVHQFWASDEKKKGLSLRWPLLGNICKDLLKITFLQLH